jgi:hypothetical protein
LKPSGLLILVSVSLAVGAWGQSLEELAQREKERRKAAKAAAKTFTNDDLAKPSPSPTPSADPAGAQGKAPRRFYQPSAPVPGGGSSNGGAEVERAQRTEGGEPPAGDGGEAYWRARAQALHETQQKTQQSIDALEARIAQLQLDRDPNPPDQLDPNRLQKRDAERLKAIEDLEKARTSLAGTQQALTDLADQARRKGAPAAWVQ